MRSRTRRLMWDLVTVLAAIGLIYGTFEYIEYAGAWKALVMVPAMMVLGWMAVNLLYPMWFPNDRG